MAVVCQFIQNPAVSCRIFECQMLLASATGSQVRTYRSPDDKYKFGSGS
jgi:hypothetical protein